MAELSITVEVSAAVRKLGAVGGERLLARLARGLAAAGQLAADRVVSAARGSLRQRSGLLFSSIVSRPDAGGAGGPQGLAIRVGVPGESPAIKYAKLLTTGIVPTNKRALTIPIGANLTGAGRARFASVAALQAAFPKKVFFGRRTIGVRASRFRTDLYFLLSRRVRGANVLAPAVEGSREVMVERIEQEIGKEGLRD